MSELDKVLQARLKHTEGSTAEPSTSTKPSAPKPKPPPPKKPQLPPKNFKPKVVSKINASLAQKDKPTPLTAKPKLPPPKKPVKDTTGKHDPSPGAAALASVLQGMAPKRHADTNGTGSLPRQSKVSRLDKAKSVEVQKPRSVSDVTNSVERPHSTSVSEEFFNESPRMRSSPVVTPKSSPLSRKRRTVSESPLKSVDSPLKSQTQSPMNTSTSSREGSAEPVMDRFERSCSLPRDVPLSPHSSVSPQTNNMLGSGLAAQSQKLEARSASGVNKKAPPTPPKKPPLLASKPHIKPKPSPPRQPRLVRESCVSRETSPSEDNTFDVKSASTSSLPDTKTAPSNESPEPHKTSPVPPRPPPYKPKSSPSPEAISRTVSSNQGDSPSLNQQEGDSPSPLKQDEEHVRNSPMLPKPPSEVPAGGSPTIRVIASSVSELSPGLKQRRNGVREKTDSGFGSEAPDDISLPRGTSVESLPQDEKVASPLSPSKEAPEEVWDEAKVEKARSKRHKIALELLSTEKTYVERIKMIAVDFHGVVSDFNVKNKQAIPQLAVQQIFLNIQQIYQLNENILQALQQRMDSWETHEGLGDVIARLAPFLKLYATYTSGFEDAMKTLTDWTKRDKKFDTTVREFERSTLGTGLGVAHYMLEPVQRIPRYKLLLADYLKYLPPESPDRPDTTKALGIISEAADRTNDRIKELENSNEILAIQRSLTDYESSLVAPSRVFLMKGELQKFSRKSETPRMFFLFSDMLLHTKPSGTGTYEFRNEMPIFGMTIEDPKVSLVPHSFNVHSTTRALILVASSEEEKMKWMTALTKVINDDMKKRSSLRRGDTLVKSFSLGDGFGTKAPIMVPDKSVTMCQTCSAAFSFTFRRHHCRACGKVVCSNCSQWKAYLKYMEKTERVCEQCFHSAKGESDDVDSGLSPKTPQKQESVSSGVLNLKALEDDAVIAAYVLSHDGRGWKKLWYQVKRDFVLYKFKAHEDIKAVHSMPLPGYIVTPDRGNSVINLIHPSSKKDLCDSFKVEDPVAYESWLAMLNKVVNMELPETTVISPTSNRSSLIDSFDLPSPPTSALNSGEDCNSAGSRTGSFSKESGNKSGSLSPVNS